LFISIEIHGLTPLVLAAQVPYKILRGKILDLCYSSAPLHGATGLLFICGLTPAILSQEIIKKDLSMPFLKLNTILNY